MTERPTQLAAALAYYGIFSFAPIIFIVVSIVGLFVENIDPASQLFQRLEELFGEGISNLIQDIGNSTINHPFEQFYTNLSDQYSCTALCCLGIVLSASVFPQ